MYLQKRNVDLSGPDQTGELTCYEEFEFEFEESKGKLLPSNDSERQMTFKRLKPSTRGWVRVPPQP